MLGKEPLCLLLGLCSKRENSRVEIGKECFVSPRKQRFMTMDTNLPTRLVNRYWRLMLLWGLLVVFFGVCALFWPYLISLTPIALFVAFALVNGVLGIILASQERRVLPSWWVAL